MTNCSLLAKFRQTKMKETPQRPTGGFLNAPRSMILRAALKSMRKAADREDWSVDDSRSFFIWIIAVSVQAV